MENSKVSNKNMLELMNKPSKAEDIKSMYKVNRESSEKEIPYPMATKKSGNTEQKSERFLQ